MKNQNQERVQFPQSKPFIINLNLTFFVVCLIVFSCGIAIVSAFFSSFPENLIILTLKLRANSENYVPFFVPTTINYHNNDRLVQYFSDPTNAPGINNGSQTEKAISSYTRAKIAHYMDNNEVMMKPAMGSRTRNVDPLERVPNAESQPKKSISSYTRADFVHDKELTTKDAMVSRARNDHEPLEKPIGGDFLHDMDDNELMMKAATVSGTPNNQSQMVPKVAFMFLVKGPMHLVPLWEKFFKGNQGLFSIYVHSPPSYTATFPEDSVFHGRRIPSKEVLWGKFNMVEAERRLLANALLDESNQRFVLLSESCIPLFNFSTIYSYLVDSKETFVEAYDKPGPVGRNRYSSRMQPVVNISQWRKGSQWFQIDRFLALQVVLDDKYFWVFKRYCKGSCYGDEHYLPTFVNIEFGERNSNRTLTWVDWSRAGPHPGKFERPQVTVGFLERLRNNRGCEYSGRGGNVCFLFARKFPPSSVIRLMRFAAKVLNIQ